MEHGTSVMSLMIVVIIAFLVPIILHRFKLNMIPVVVAEIIVGIIIGKSGFNIIHEDVWLGLLSSLGFIFLMFLSGLEIDFKLFDRKRGKKEAHSPVKVSFYIFIGILVISYGLSVILVLMGIAEDPYLLTLIISTISLGVVVPVLKEKKIIDTGLGQTILLVAVLSDFATMVLLAIYVMFKSKDPGESLYLLVLFVLVFVIYRFIKRYFHVKLFDSLMSGTIQLGTRGVFALILFFVALSEHLGAESILGAFLAGIIVSILSPKKEFVHKLDSFGYGFFIPVFFVMVGVNIDIMELLSDKKIVLLIPVLLLMLYVSKIVPSLLLRRYYPWKEVMSSGVLLTSTLSLVIAATAIGVEIGVMDQKLSNAFILVAVITCLISPIFFNKKVKEKEDKNKRLTIIGANRITLPVSIDFVKEGYDVRLLGTKQKKMEAQEAIKDDKQFPIEEIDEITIEKLRETNAFDTDVIVISTNYDEKNIKIAEIAKEEGIEEVIVKVESPDEHKRLLDEGYGVFSTLYSTRMLLRALVDNIGFVRLITKHNDSIQEMQMRNPRYDGIVLRKIPFLGDALILQIYRNEESILPHGDTVLKEGDRIVVSGSIECVKKMREEFE